MKGNGTVLMQHDLWWHGLAPFFGRVSRRGQYCTGQFHIVAADRRQNVAPFGCLRQLQRMVGIINDDNFRAEDDHSRSEKG